MKQEVAPLRIGLALGAGGAKGLAHVVALEACDQAGIRPAAIAGCSIGAIVGAAYAAGYSGRAIRDHALKRFRDRADVMAKVFRARTGSLATIFSGGLGSIVQVDGETLLQAFWPPSMPERFADLRLPFAAVATDFHGRTERVFTEGALRPAVAASMAIPGLVKPVLIDGRPHVDGAVVNPLPFDRLPAPCDLIVAVNVVGGRVAEDPGAMPSMLDATFGSSLIMQDAIVEARLKLASTRVHVVRPDIGAFYALDFFGTKKILEAAEPIRAEIAGLIGGGSSPSPPAGEGGRRMATG